MPRHGTSTRREQSRRYYEAHKDVILAKRKAARAAGEIAATQRERRAEYRRKAAAMKARPCCDCGVEYPPYVMDFDHVRGEKLMNVAALIGKDYGWDVVLEEIQKCEVVCANCHRERTHRRRHEDVL